jgi:RNA polymerase sigma-70 factor (ECF subfamily)
MRPEGIHRRAARLPHDVEPDEVLGARVARGDVAAFGAVYDRYAPRVHAWASHALGPAAADDAVQEVFTRVWRKAHQFEPARGRYATWLMAIARHHIVRQLQRAGRERRVVAEDIAEVIGSAVDPQPDVADRVWASEQERTLARALRDLPEEQRRVLVLGYFLGMTQSEMARALGIPLGTVKKRVRLGMQKLRAALAPVEIPFLRVLGDE